MIKGIIFDCFGVLIADDLRARVEAVDKVNPKDGQELHDIMRAIDRGLLSRQESSEQMSGLLGIDSSELLKALTEGLVKNTEMVEFVRTLRPKFKVGLLSNVRGRDRLEELFESGELDELFDAVVASGDIGIIKPESEIYEFSAKNLGVLPKDCVMIDDRVSFCEGAEAVGMRSILFKSNDQVKQDLSTLIDRENRKD